MKPLLTLVALLASIGPAEATRQTPDTIEYDGHIFYFGSRDHVSPIQDYLAKHPEKTPAEFAVAKTPLWTSGLWRGHIARYRVAGGKLWIVSIEVPVHAEDYDPVKDRVVNDIRFYAPFPLGKLFPGPEPAVHADWFTGTLWMRRAPSKEELEAHPGASTKHEALTFEDGVLRRPKAAERSDAPEP